MKQVGRLSENAELVSFPRESTYSLGNVTYRVEAHFREEGKSLPETVKRALLGSICKAALRTLAKPPPGEYHEGATLLIWRQGRRNHGKAK